MVLHDRSAIAWQYSRIPLHAVPSNALLSAHPNRLRPWKVQFISFSNRIAAEHWIYFDGVRVITALYRNSNAPAPGSSVNWMQRKLISKLCSAVLGWLNWTYEIHVSLQENLQVLQFCQFENKKLQKRWVDRFISVFGMSIDNLHLHNIR